MAELNFGDVSQAAPAVPLHSVVGWDRGEQGRTSPGVSSAGRSAVQSSKEPAVPEAPCKGQLMGQKKGLLKKEAASGDVSFAIP